VTAQVLEHLKRDLFHTIWGALLDDKFIHAYIHGLVVTLSDHISRLAFPRFFIYLMDYPEK
jgi:hypothetical protein